MPFCCLPEPPPGDWVVSKGVGMGGFWQLLCRLGRRLYPSLYTRAADNAMDRLLRDVLLPLYLRHLSPSSPPTQGNGPSASPLTQGSDTRVVLLLCGYGPSLWRLFRLYAVSPMGAMPRHLHFPDDAQQSEVCAPCSLNM